MPTYRLISEPGSEECDGCGERKERASYTLTREAEAAQPAKRWRLCGSHAAKASWMHGIPHRVFNPRGERLPEPEKRP